MRLYMQLGQLAVVIDCTLFVHGGVYGVFDKTKGIQSCVGLVPRGDDLSDQRTFENREDWLLQLNNWMASQVAACIKSPAYTADRSTRAGQALFLYASYSPNPSVIMARMLDESSMPLPVPQDIASKLKNWGIHRVVCGHTPHGNAPTVTTSHDVQVCHARSQQMLPPIHSTTHLVLLTVSLCRLSWPTPPSRTCHRRTDPLTTAVLLPVKCLFADLCCMCTGTCKMALQWILSLWQVGRSSSRLLLF